MTMMTPDKPASLDERGVDGTASIYIVHIHAFVALRGNMAERKLTAAVTPHNRALEDQLSSLVNPNLECASSPSFRALLRLPVLLLVHCAMESVPGQQRHTPSLT